MRFLALRYEVGGAVRHTEVREGFASHSQSKKSHIPIAHLNTDTVISARGMKANANGP